MAEIEKLVKRQLAIKDEIAKAALNNSKAGKARKTRGYFSTRLSILSEQWSQFSQNHIEIWESKDNAAENKYFTDNTYEVTEEMFFELVADLNAGLDDYNERLDNKSISQSSAKVKLPAIAIPKFDGNYKSWRSFHDLFSSLIASDANLSKVQKLHYLKTNVTGEAERLLRQFEIVESNFDKAWELLTKRYNNKRALVNHQLKTLLNQSQIKIENSTTIKTFLDQTEECIHELQALDLPTDKWDAILIHILVQKLPPDTHYHWEQELRNKTGLPTYREFTTFLETRFRTLEALNEGKKLSPPKPTYGLFNKSKSSSPKPKPSGNSKTSCSHCRGNHIIFRCPSFRNLSTQQRNDVATSRHLCKNCLSPNHKTPQCPSNKRCFHCSKNHNTLLHYEQGSSTSVPKPSHDDNQKSPMDTRPELPKLTPTSQTHEQQVQNFYTSNMKRALLSTALINIAAPSGITMVFRALIDSGSQVSIMTERAYKRLQLKGHPTNHELIGLGTTPTNTANKQATVTLKSLHTNFKTKVNMLVIKKITDLLPAQTINVANWQHIENLPLADPTFATPGEIDILLGAETYAEILSDGIKRGPCNTPTAQNTKLGWILIGAVPEAKQVLTTVLTTQTQINNMLNNQLKRFWELEECPTNTIHSPEDQLCENMYKETTTRLPNGKYEVHLPFRDQMAPQLGQTRHIAIKQFLQIERKLHNDPELFKLYQTCINEYTQLGHMKLIPATQIQAENKHYANYPFYYLPHHAVIKDSTTTKLRVVFNASARSSNGRSLNEQLLIGPTIQPTLWTILLRWRLYKFAFTADVEKMYRMIQMTSKHQNYQRIIWRDSPNEKLKDYALTTVTFGTAPAPYLAIKALQQLGQDEADIYPRAAKSIKNDFYVDDLVTGAHNLDEALQLQHELIEALKRGTFNLRKWTANHPELLKHIPLEHRELKENLEFSENTSIKTLGIRWYPTTDHFSFKVEVPEFSNAYTKRVILSEVASLFDPLGWLAPSIVTAKILIQKLWLIKCDWDEVVPDELSKEWICFKSQLHALQEIKIPRWLGYEPTAKIELHGFCDASNHAYSAVLYIKIEEEQGSRIQLITAKTKVAPIKPVSLPRLELCGAVLLSRLFRQVIQDFKFENVKTIAWTDSKIALAWIQKHPSTWKTFVANRVAEIHENTPQASWRYVPSKQNPADVASRGILPKVLTTTSIWWNGPDWLCDNEDSWPQHTTELQTELECKRNKILTTTTIDEQNELLNKYSSHQKAVRVTAYCLRFINSMRKQHPTTPYLSVSELKGAERRLIKMLQREVFSSEITCLQKNQPIPKKSRLLSLNPTLDSESILRVGSRLTESQLSYDQKHPIILPNKHHFTDTLIDHIHHYTLHGGTQIILNVIRNSYWLLNARNTIRYRVHKCTTCFRFNARPASQLMSSLPSARVNVSLPFVHTGIDYAGPIDMKSSTLRGSKITKAYICFFVCLATKATHIELVSDLSTSAFLAALRRFVGRRGLCSHIYSDRGTNFIGANRLLQNNLEKAIKNIEADLANDVANKGITWHFNPPAAPHFGGLWESGVKSTKRHLYKTIKNTKLSYEELYTVLVQVEACLNARPLSPLSNDATDYNVLTPGHFLTGRHCLNIVEPSPLDMHQHPIKRWQHIQWLSHNFWKKWSRDYLHTLHQRHKWQTEKDNLQIDSLVLLKEDQIPIGQWPMGRIIEIHPGHNNLVRAVTIKTPKTILTRPISRVCPLPITYDSPQ